MDNSYTKLNGLHDQGSTQSYAVVRDLMAMADALPHPAWAATQSGQWLWSNSLWSRQTGLSAQDSQGQGWRQALDPLGGAAFDAAWRRAPLDGSFNVEHRLQNVRGQGEAQWFNTQATPLNGIAADEPVWLGVCTDVHRLKQLERHEMEGHDRITSLLAMTRHVARQTAASTHDRDDLILHVDSRLDAMARVYGMSRRQSEAGVSLGRLVNDALLAHGAQDDGDRVEVDGPDVNLPSKYGEIFGLVINELAMNAVKHGALSEELGRIVVRWRVEAGAAKSLRFEWLETDVSVPEVPPGYAGYGTDLIETVLPRETGASASLGFGKRGVCCTVVLPLPAGNTRPFP